MPQNAEIAPGICSQGLGVEKNWEEAIRCFRTSADEEYSYAQLRLGHMYFDNGGAPKDDEKSLELHEKSGENGNEEGQYSADSYFGLNVFPCRRQHDVDIEYEWTP